MANDLGTVWTAAAVVMGFAVTSISWRIKREVELADDLRRTWLAPADYLSVSSMLVVAGGGIRTPDLGSRKFGFSSVFSRPIDAAVHGPCCRRARPLRALHSSRT